MTKTTIKNGSQLFVWLPFFLCLFFSLSLRAEPADSGSPEQRLRYATPELAVRLIDQYQPAYNEQTSGQWYSWEQTRFALLEKLEAWQTIVSRIDSWPRAVWERYYVEALLLRSRSLLKMSRTEHVRDALRGLLFSERELDTEQIAQARQLIIRSYLAEGRSSNARRAMLRYRQDYGIEGEAWRLLQARVLLASGRYQQAWQLLKKEKTEDIEPFKWLARLNLGEVSALKVYKDALYRSHQKKGKKKESPYLLDVSLRRQYLILSLIAAKKLNDLPAQINSLEKILVTGNANSENDLELVNADNLWAAYREYATELGNQYQLLVGDDARWLDRARTLEIKEKLKARSLLAYLGTSAKTAEDRRLALETFADILKVREQGPLLLEMLFIQGSQFGALSDIPVVIRYQLLDDMLSRGQIQQAAKLFATLPEPPNGKQRLAWDLRRARVLVLGGQYNKATELLRQLINSKLDKTALNRLMQVLFDLQKVDQHSQAIELFGLIRQRNRAPDFDRELLFWQAESWQALKQYEKAAHLFLVSALMIEEKQFDPWSQTARYHAAGALVSAGLINDARQLYRSLLRETKDPARRATIKQQLQQIWLLEGKENSDQAEGGEDAAPDTETGIGATESR